MDFYSIYKNLKQKFAQKCANSQIRKRKNKMNFVKNIQRGGFLAGKRTYLVAVAGILSAVGAYLTGDASLTDTLNIIFPLGAICFLRRGMRNEK